MESDVVSEELVVDSDDSLEPDSEDDDADDSVEPEDADFSVVTDISLEADESTEDPSSDDATVVPSLPPIEEGDDSVAPLALQLDPFSVEASETPELVTSVADELPDTSVTDSLDPDETVLSPETVESVAPVSFPSLEVVWLKAETELTESVDSDSEPDPSVVRSLDANVVPADDPLPSVSSPEPSTVDPGIPVLTVDSHPVDAASLIINPSSVIVVSVKSVAPNSTAFVMSVVSSVSSVISSEYSSLQSPSSSSSSSLSSTNPPRLPTVTGITSSGLHDVGLHISDDDKISATLHWVAATAVPFERHKTFRVF